MSTLFEAPSKREETAPSIEPFVYSSVPVTGSGPRKSALGDRARALVQGSLNGTGNGNADGESDPEMRAREEALREGLARARAEFEQGLAKEREGLAVEIRNFRKDREVYFQQVEAEVVRLALKIARRILHREAQMDPLLIRGAVRVFLESVAQGTSVKLRLNPKQVSAWREYLAAQQDNKSLEVVGDSSLEPGQCLVETAMGVTDFSPEVQLQEIERGFFDLMTPPLGST
jgi:flagellar biosynthesis/type III secretory pathway protein FliH